MDLPLAPPGGLVPYQAPPPGFNRPGSKGWNPDPPVTQPPSPISTNGSSMYTPDPKAGSHELSPGDCFTTPPPTGDAQVHTPPPAPRSSCTNYGPHDPRWGTIVLNTPGQVQTGEPPGFYHFGSPSRQCSPSPPAGQTPFYSVSAPRHSGRQRRPVIQPFNVYGDEAPVDTLH